MNANEATARYVLGYLTYIAKHRSSSVATAQTHVSAIAYHYRIQGLNSVTDHALVRMYLRGVTRAHADIPVKR